MHQDCLCPAGEVDTAGMPWLLLSHTGCCNVVCCSHGCCSATLAATMSAAVVAAKGGCGAQCGASLRLHAADKSAAAHPEQVHLLMPPGLLQSSQRPSLTSQQHGLQQAMNGA